MAKGPSQLMELFLAVAESLGHQDNEAIASLADAGPENVANWRSGSVREFKAGKFRAALASIRAQLETLRTEAGRLHTQRPLTALEIEDSANPTNIQRQFRERIYYDYLGHRFLYFDPQGALAWENLIRAGYEQNCWLAGVEDCARTWFELKTDGTGTPKGAISTTLALGRRDKPKGLDIVSLGPGEGGKEVAVLSTLLAMSGDRKRHPSWVSLSLVDVSIPLLLTAARRARIAVADTTTGAASSYSIRPFCADFEDGSLAFLKPLRTSTQNDEGIRLVLLLGNVLGNVRDEELFFREKLSTMVRPGDLLWVEVGLRQQKLADDPLFSATVEEAQETAAQASRRLLLEGPYRRWAAASGRSAPNLKTRIWLREGDDTSRVPGSINFCHDLLLEDEGRVCTMLYSRRYEQSSLLSWFEAQRYEVLGIRKTADSTGADRVVHVLMRRKQR